MTLCKIHHSCEIELRDTNVCVILGDTERRPMNVNGRTVNTFLGDITTKCAEYHVNAQVQRYDDVTTARFKIAIVMYAPIPHRESAELAYLKEQAKLCSCEHISIVVLSDINKDHQLIKKEVDNVNSFYIQRASGGCFVRKDLDYLDVVFNVSAWIVKSLDKSWENKPSVIANASPVNIMNIVTPGPVTSYLPSPSLTSTASPVDTGHSEHTPLSLTVPDTPIMQAMASVRCWAFNGWKSQIFNNNHVIAEMFGEPMHYITVYAAGDDDDDDDEYDRRARNGSRQTKLLYITKTKTKNVNKKYNVWLRWTKPSHKPNPSNDHGVIMADIIEIRQGNDSDLKISIVCKSRTYVFEWSTPRERNCWLSVLQYVTAVCKN